MDPFERWDDWEWEKAVQALGQKKGSGSPPWRERGSGRKNRPAGKRDFLSFWTGGQKRTVLAAVLFLTVFFSANGQDIVSKGIYSAYRTSRSADYYATLTGMAKEALGLGGASLTAMPVDSKMKGKFMPPVSGPVEAGFGITNAEGRVHEGIDVGSSLGTKVVSPYNGVVTEVGKDSQLGNVVKIDYGDGWSGVLGNLGDILVRKGDKVDIGQQIGTVGLSAPLQKPWLHIELRKDNKAVDPLPYFISTAS